MRILTTENSLVGLFIPFKPFEILLSHASDSLYRCITNESKALSVKENNDCVDGEEYNYSLQPTFIHRCEHIGMKSVRCYRSLLEYTLHIKV